MNVKNAYLIVAILGTVLPYYELFQFIGEEGWSVVGFGEALFVNHASSMGAIDLLISSLVFLIFVEYEGRKLGMRHRWVYIVVNLLIGLSAGLPLFLYVRERQLAEKSVAEAVAN
ncbi:MAG: DUF2834 domain-containing protein [Cyclobacteriaceae bacterium]